MLPLCSRTKLVRVEGVEVGILLSKEEDDGHSEGVTHWIVSVDGSSEEEVVSEKMIGRVLDDLEQSDSSTVEKTQRDRIPVKKASVSKVKFAPRGKKVNRHINKRPSGEEPEYGGDMESLPKQAPKPKKKPGDETVIKVKMLTGTLFIYRGENHRVEFNRTV